MNCTDWFKVVNIDIIFFSLRKHLYQLCGVFGETAVCTPCRNPAMTVHVETCAFYFLAGWFISAHKIETKSYGHRYCTSSCHTLMFFKALCLTEKVN